MAEGTAAGAVLASPSRGSTWACVLGNCSPGGRWSWVEPSAAIWLPAELPSSPTLLTGLQASRDPPWGTPTGEAAADTVETAPRSPFLLGIYELPRTSRVSPPGDPQPAQGLIPASQ